MISCTTKRLVAFSSFYTLLYDFFPREFVRGVQKSAPVNWTLSNKATSPKFHQYNPLAIILSLIFVNSAFDF